jgi:hypothetical protein
MDGIVCDRDGIREKDPRQKGAGQTGVTGPWAMPVDLPDEKYQEENPIELGKR